MDGNEKKKACLYARYSSENQSEVSIEYQREAIKKYSEENNFIIVQEYIDRARTGTNGDREAFQQMFKDLTGKHEWETILVYCTDRLSRDALISLESMAKFLKGRVNVIFTSQPAYNNNDYASRFARNIQFASDAMQSEVTSDHTHKAMKVKATQGIFLGGQPPLGYDAIVKSHEPLSGKSKEKVLAINPKEAKIVRRIFEMFLAGMSYTAMAKEEQKMITVVMLEPGKQACRAEIDGSLQGMQKVVGGLIEPFYPLDFDIVIVCNEEGKLIGLPLNRAVYNPEGEMVDIIAGTAFVCERATATFGSLNKEQIERYMTLFKYPETFVRVGEKIVDVPFLNKNF